VQPPGRNVLQVPPQELATAQRHRLALVVAVVLVAERHGALVDLHERSLG
jgi:hypothetical protein